MAERHWVGASSGTWNSAANWSATQGGAGGAGVPTTGDDVYIDKTITSASMINVNQDIGAINSLTFSDYSTNGVAWYLGGGGTPLTLGTSWNVPNNITINTANGTAVYGILNISFLGTSNIIKTGGGGLVRDRPASGSWGTTTIDLQGGYVAGAGLNNALGTGTVTMSNGTGFSNGSAGTAYTFGNPLVINGDVYFNVQLDNSSLALADLTLSGTINLGSSVRTINVGGTTSNSAIISGLISGTGGFTKDGTGQLDVNSSLSGLTGTTSLTNGLLYLYSPSFSALTISHPTAGIRSTKTIFLRPTVTNGYSFPAGFNLTGNGSIHVSGASVTSLTTGFTFPAGATSGLTGTSAGTTAGGATAGLALIASASVTSARIITVNLNDLPSVLTFEFNYDTTNVALVQNLYYVSSNLTHNYSTRFDVLNYSGTTAIGTGSHTVNFYADQASGPLVISGNFNRASALSTYTAVLTLRGSNSNDNEISGNITQTSGIIAVTKNDGGTWVLSGTNTYTGANTLTAGTLNIRSAAALGSSAATTATTLTAGTLQVQGNITINKASSAWALNGSIIENVSGTNVITAASWTIGTTQSIVTTAGSLQVTNAIAGTSARTLTKSGSGILYLSNTANGYLGTVTVSAGELQIQNLANAGVACSLGTQATAQATITMGGNTTLTHKGTTSDSTDRNITCNGSSGTSLVIDSSGTGSGAITYSSGGTLSFTGAGTHDITFQGTNSNTNTFARTIADGPSGATSIQKLATNTWVLSTITATGIAACYDGILNFGSVNLTTISTLYASGGTIAITTGNTIAANTVMNGGSITAVLTGNKTLLVDSSSSEVYPSILQPDDSTNGNNTFTGNVTIDGCLDMVTPTSVSPSTAGKGRVLGTSNTVTVSSTGVLRTKFTNTSNQRASARYHNLTFQSGSNLKIGYAD